MDKFGIFKLLNSISTSLSAQSGDNIEKKEEKPSDNILDGITNFFRSMSNLKGQPNTTSEPPFSPDKNGSFTDKTSNLQGSLGDIDKKPTAPHPPLNAKMLSVMRSHDELVKRVKTTNKN